MTLLIDIGYVRGDEVRSIRQILVQPVEHLGELVRRAHFLLRSVKLAKPVNGLTLNGTKYDGACPAEVTGGPGLFEFVNNSYQR